MTECKGQIPRPDHSLNNFEIQKYYQNETFHQNEVLRRSFKR